MRSGEIKRLVENTLDAAFAVDGTGLIMAWNKAAAELTGVSSEEAMGRPCGELIQGTDQCGPVCSPDCTVRQAVRKHHPLSNYDLQIKTRNGMQWCNISVLIADEAHSIWPFAIHILRPIDIRKRLELTLQDFLIAEIKVPAGEVPAIISSTRAPARATDLTKRELEILRLISTGLSTLKIAAQLNISPTTANNHIQHILRKLDAHNRLEAVRRAEHAGLI